MMTERFRAVVDRAAQLPPETQDRLADALAEVLDQVTDKPEQPSSPPSLAPDVRVALERVLARHAESLEYLKGR